MEAAFKNQPGSALIEVRLESSVATVGLFETYPICGNRKRRCLLPPNRSRKKHLEERSPSSSPTRPVLLRPESSPLPSSRSAGLSVTPSQPPHLRSHPFPSRLFGRTIDPAFTRNLESAAEAFRSLQPTIAPTFLHPSPRSVPAPPPFPFGTVDPVFACNLESAVEAVLRSRSSPLPSCTRRSVQEGRDDGRLRRMEGLDGRFEIASEDRFNGTAERPGGERGAVLAPNAGMGARREGRWSAAKNGRPRRPIRDCERKQGQWYGRTARSG